MNNAIERINKVLISDKYINPESIINVMRSDLINVAANYLEFDKQNVITNLKVNNNGQYEFCFKINAQRIKCLGILPYQF